ncbi:MAG TPA: anti-sigma factor [Pyrinomonadaceae bacterium]
MTDEQKELLYDLIVKRVTEGLSTDERKQLEQFDPELVKRESFAFETTAAAIGMASIEIERMPEHLVAKVVASAPAATRADPEFDGNATIPSMAPTFTADDVFERKPRTFIFGLLGWVAAAILLVVLGAQLYSVRLTKQPDNARIVLPSPTVELTPAEQRDELLRSAPDVISATWAPGNMKDMQVSGDVVWSDAKQKGYMRLRGLPPNDPATTSYQLWIFDKGQDQATPIDGGVFDVSSNGDIVIPVDADIRTIKPEMFAVTMERAGGVVVSKREKIAALAKVETQKT